MNAKPSFHSPQVISALLALGLAGSMTLTSGCSLGDQSKTQAMEALKQQVAELESENEQMRSQLGLKQTLPTSQGALKDQASNTNVAVQAINQVLAADPKAGVIAFTDIADLPTQKFITDLNRLGFFQGLVQGTAFNPYKPISRGEYATWLFKAYNLLRPEADQIHLTPNAPQKFKDLSAKHPAYPFVQALSEAGFSLGLPDGTFKPDKALTRQEMIGLKFGVDTGKAYDVPSFYSDLDYTDRDEVSDRYKGYLYQDWWQGSGPYKGNINRAFGKTRVFKPQQFVLRHEAAATLWQVDKNGTFTAEKALASASKASAKPSASSAKQ